MSSNLDFKNNIISAKVCCDVNSVFSCQKVTNESRQPLTLSLQNKLSSAIFLVCFNFQSASMWLKVGENVVRVSNSLDKGETPSYSASHHPDPSYLHMALKSCLAV